MRIDRVLKCLVAATVIAAAPAPPRLPVGDVASLPPGVRTDFEAGQKAVAANDGAAAVAAFDRVVGAAPDFGEAYAGRGMAYYQTKDLAHAEEDLSRALKMGVSDKTRGFIVGLLGVAYRADQKPGDAIRTYTDWLQSNHDPIWPMADWNIYMQRAEAYAQRHDFTAAKADLNRSLRLSPDNPQVVDRSVLVDAQAHDWANALGAADELVALRPDDPEALKLHEIVLQSAHGAGVTAAAATARAASDDPLARGLFALRHGDASVDFTMLRMATAHQPGYKARPWPEQAATQAKLRSGDARGALKAADDRLAVAYLDPGAHFVAFGALKALGRPIEAQRHLTALNGILHSINASGDGKTAATAWKVISVEEEYLVIGVRGLKPGTQQLVPQDAGHVYDRLDVTDQQGRPQSLWFDVGAFFGREA